MVRSPQDSAPSKTHGDNSATRGVGIMGGPIFLIVLLVVFALIVGMFLFGIPAVS
jgi:hypothetical protein